MIIDYLSASPIELGHLQVLMLAEKQKFVKTSPLNVWNLTEISLDISRPYSVRDTPVHALNQWCLQFSLLQLLRHRQPIFPPTCTTKSLKVRSDLTTLKM